MLSNSRATSSPIFGCSSFKVFTCCCSTVIRMEVLQLCSHPVIG
jgi:hypothetical protein